MGTICRILQILKTSETSVRVIVEGQQRARIHRLWQGKPFLQANVELLEEEFPGRITPRMEAMMRQTYVLFGEYKELVPSSTTNSWQRCWTAAIPVVWRISSPRTSICGYNASQRVLEELRPLKRLRLLNDILAHEVEVISLEVEMEQKVRSRVARCRRT